MYPYNNYNFQPQVQFQQPMAQQQQTQIPRVHGEEGAKAYPLAPNSSILLLDETDSVVWVKMTDSAGFPTVRRFRITEEPEAIPATSEYVTLDAFNALQDKVNNLLEELK